MKTYEELRELAKEVQIRQDAELQKAIDEQICKIEQRIADELFSGAKEIEWYGKLYPECIRQLLKSGFSVEHRNPNYIQISSIHIIYKSDNPVYLDKWQEDTDRHHLKYMAKNKKSFLQKLFS
jgi:hypothetical protein